MLMMLMISSLTLHELARACFRADFVGWMDGWVDGWMSGY